MSFLRATSVFILVALCLCLGLAAVLHASDGVSFPSAQPWWIDSVVKLSDAFARLLKAIAWPAVVLFLLFLLRPHFGDLVAKIEEAEFFGGTKFKFESKRKDAIVNLVTEKKNETAETSAETPSQSVLVKPDGLNLKAMMVEPLDDITDAYTSLLIEIERLGRRFGINSKDSARVMRQLNTQGQISKEIYTLYRNLRDMFHIADRSGTRQVSVQQARQYRELISEALPLIMNVKP